ncbi:hypothetical protein [Paenibacillus puerhi]|uniref:hypothetical protein n=1 Tax=Paenibacillus puerhi TaxID=2692622 RepID=UPI00135C790C|nr:hypothetical protein [Paenibacillus puerhi]
MKEQSVKSNDTDNRQKPLDLIENRQKLPSPQVKEVDKESELTAIAWEKLQARLKPEERAPEWTAWSRGTAELPSFELDEAFAPEASRNDDLEVRSGKDGAATLYPANTGFSSANGKRRTESSHPRAGRTRRFAIRYTKWAAIAAAVCIGVAVIATPSGNQALASLLNQFRMQQVTEVHVDDLERLLYSAVGDGNRREEINKFGTFTRQTGMNYGKVSAEQAESVIGSPLVLPAELRSDSYSLNLSAVDEITFTINVKEINQAMKRMGATKLLPESVNGKTIRLKTGPKLHAIPGREKGGYSLSQQPVPVVEVEGSVPITEAMEAVLDFPLLPEYIKENLRRADMTSGGSIPLPVITGQQTEKVKIDSTDVLLIMDQDWENSVYYSASWVQNGLLIQLYGNGSLTSREAMLDKTKELINS